MKNYKIEIQYDGTDFFGWQVQAEARTVQGDIEAVFQKIAPDQKITLYGAGRTDSGVHARGQVANINLDINLTTNDIKNALNANLKNDVRITNCTIVDDDFHARYSPISRKYEYKITTKFSPFTRHFESHVRYDLDFENITECAKLIIGEHDFTAFCKTTAEVDHKRCLVFSSIWDESADKLTYVIRANRFLHHMVRYLVGTMIEVGRGRMKIWDFEQFLNRGHQTLTVFKAPAKGLFLDKIYYPKFGTGTV